jgi:spore coat-associated protein N
MKRLNILAHRRRAYLLGSLGALLVAAAVAVGSGASFNATSATAANTMVAGNLTASNDHSGSAVLSGVGMVPGNALSGTCEITNTGNVAATFTLNKGNLVDTPGPNHGTFSSELKVKIEDTTIPATPVIKYNGSIGSMTPLDCGVYSAGATKTYKFTVTFPDGGTPTTATAGDNAFQGTTFSVRYDWTAVAGS